MRILLITDSLGCPRPEIKASITWTDRILKQLLSSGDVVYTYCQRGLSAKAIDLEYVRDLEPDIIITQIGIVDASRRALRGIEQIVASRIPVFGKVINRFCSRYHYFITSKRTIHYCNLPKFKEIVESISNIAKSRGGAVLFVCIAPPGDYLIKRVYKIEHDIVDYNDAIKQIDGITFVNPYVTTSPSAFLLDDGHHLNQCGHDLVFNCVRERLTSLL